MSKEIRIGIFTLITAAVLITGFYYLKARNVFQSNSVYYAVYEKVDGLYESDQVTINGFPVGTVEKIQLIHKDLGKILLRLEVKGDVAIPDNSVALMYSADLLGEKAIRILQGTSKNVLKENDTISTEITPTIIEQFGQEIVPLSDKAQGMLGKVDTTVSGINKLFDENREGNIYEVIKNLNATSQNLVDISASLKTQLATGGSLDRSLKNVESVTNNLKTQNEKINAVIGNIKDFTDTLKEADINATISDLRHTINTIDSLVAAIDHGGGATQKLIHETVLYDNLKSTTENLNTLLKNFESDRRINLHVSFRNKDRKKNNTAPAPK